VKFSLGQTHLSAGKLSQFWLENPLAVNPKSAGNCIREYVLQDINYLKNNL
jgi:hypothetical protein